VADRQRRHANVRLATTNLNRWVHDDIAIMRGLGVDAYRFLR